MSVTDRFRHLGPGLGLIILAATLVVCTPRDAEAGAWAQEDKGLYAKLAFARSLATEQYKETGETFQLLSEDEKGRFDSWALQMYAELGLLPKLTVTMSTQVMSAKTESDLVRIRTTGVSDVRAGLKYQFLDKPLVLSAATRFTVPTGYTPRPGGAEDADARAGRADVRGGSAGRQELPSRADLRLGDRRLSPARRPNLPGG